LGKDEMRNPRAFLHELLGRLHLLPIVAGNEADQHVRVNGAHTFPASAAGSPPSVPHPSVCSARWRTPLDGCPRMRIVPPSARRPSPPPLPTRARTPARCPACAGFLQEPRSAPER